MSLSFLLILLTIVYILDAWQAEALHSILNSNFKIGFEDVARKDKSFHQTIARIISENFARKQSTANIIQGNEMQARSSFGLVDLQDEVIKKVFESPQIVLRVESAANIQYIRNRLKTCNIILVETLQSFLHVNDIILPHVFNFNGYYAIVLMNGQDKDIDEILKVMWKKHIFNVCIILNGLLGVQVFKFDRFTQDSCYNAKPSHFEVAQNPIESLFYGKLRDLKNCSIKVGAPRIEPFVMMNERNEIVGRDVDLIKTLAKALNFNLDLHFMNQPQAYGMLFDNGTAIGAFKDLIDSNVDMIIGDYFLKLNRLPLLDSSASYYSSKIIFVIPPGRRLKSIEKLLQPFSTTFWILLILNIVAIMSVIAFLKHKWKRAATQMLEGRSAYVSMLSIMFAISQPTLPRKSFARILMMSFIMFCILVQATYQGLLYKHLQTDSTRKEVQSINEMIDQDFKFFSTGSTDELFEGNSKIKRRYLIFT